MTKRRLRPRVHSFCGKPLEEVLLVEVIPSECYYIQVNEYIEGDIPESTPDLTEWRCAACNEKITGQDLNYVTARMKRSQDG